MSVTARNSISWEAYIGEMHAMLTGLFLVVLRGCMNGSFATPMKRIRGWKWEHIWLLWALVALIVVPDIAAVSTVPKLTEVYRHAGIAPVALAASLGLGWGISAILFGRGVERLGLSVGFGIILGISSAFGALVPLFVLQSNLVSERFALGLFGGIALVLTGVAFCTIAGIQREGRVALHQSTILSGFVICVLSGLGSPMINFALNFGRPIRWSAQQMGASSVNSENAIWPIILGAAFIVNASYCIWLMWQRKNISLLAQSGWQRNIILSALMGALWMGSNLACGYGSQAMGSLGMIVGWPIMMGSIILTSSGWGVLTGEWKMASASARQWMMGGVTSLLAGIAMLDWASR